MPEDSSLTEFIETEGDLETSHDGDDQQESDESIATVTYAWAETEQECTACGETTTRRWIGGEGLVCASCKSW